MEKSVVGSGAKVEFDDEVVPDEDARKKGLPPGGDGDAAPCRWTADDGEPAAEAPVGLEARPAPSVSKIS